MTAQTTSEPTPRDDIADRKRLSILLNQLMGCTPDPALPDPSLTPMTISPERLACLQERYRRKIQARGLKWPDINVRIRKILPHGDRRPLLDHKPTVDRDFVNDWVRAANQVLRPYVVTRLMPGTQAYIHLTKEFARTRAGPIILMKSMAATGYVVDKRQATRVTAGLYCKTPVPIVMVQPVIRALAALPTKKPRAPRGGAGAAEPA